LFIDANLAVLLVVGASNRADIGKHRRVREFLPEDFDRVVAYAADFREVVFTPNVLTETSNLMRQGPEWDHITLAAAFKSLTDRATEIYVGSRKATLRPEFARLGLTDAALLEALGPGDVLLTVDFDLAGAVTAAGLTAVNYNHIRYI
jgi:hypothetical protein